VHALWYATVEGRNPNEFVHLGEDISPPAGKIVIGMGPDCYDCDLIKESGDFILYRSY
jgi:hypothetical protein